MHSKGSLGLCGGNELITRLSDFKQTAAGREREEQRGGGELRGRPPVQQSDKSRRMAPGQCADSKTRKQQRGQREERDRAKRWRKREQGEVRVRGKKSMKARAEREGGRTGNRLVRVG